MLSKGYPFIPIRTLQHKLKQGALNNMKHKKSEAFFLDNRGNNEINSHQDPLEFQMCEKNPWIVEEISEFLKYSCPECDHNYQKLELFQEHVRENHTNSTMLFKIKSDQEDFKNIDSIDPLKIECEETNPWLVENISVFLKYCCPECDFNDPKLETFTNHALENHSLSSLLFGKSMKESCVPSISKEVLGLADDHQDMENCFNEVVSLDTTMINEELLETSKLSVAKEITQQEIQGPKTLASLKDQLIASVMTPYPCPICKKGLSSKSALRSHIDSVHERKKPHLCPSCGKSFAKKDSLKVHYDIAHEGIKAFKCLDCNACFAFKKRLKNHKANKCAKTLVAINDENKPFKCSLCYMNFSSKKTIRRHIFSVHEEKKPNKVHRVKENESDRNIFAVHKEKESVIVKKYGKPDKCFLSIEKTSFSCGIWNKTFDKKCDFSFDSNLELTIHITSVHCKKVIQAKVSDKDEIHEEMPPKFHTTVSESSDNEIEKMPFKSPVSDKSKEIETSPIDMPMD